MKRQNSLTYLMLLFYSVLTAAPLAVEFLGMEADVGDRSVILRWSTATETQNLGFILERKTDSLAVWDPLSSYITNDNLLGQGTVSTPTDYSYADSLVTEGQTYFYRISGVDVAGNIGILDSISVLYTETATVPIVPVEFALTVYPNPFNHRTLIRIRNNGLIQSGADQMAISHFIVNIYHAGGTFVGQIFNGRIAFPGNHEFVWDPAGLASGVYICTLQIDRAYLVTHKIVLVK